MVILANLHGASIILRYSILCCTIVYHSMLCDVLLYHTILYYIY